MQYKGILLVCDLDNTVVFNDTISDSDIASALAFISRGGLLTVATGRIRDSAKRFVSMLSANCPVICQNGGYLYDYTAKKELNAMVMDGAAGKIAGELMECFPRVKVQVFSRQRIYFLGYEELPGGPERYKVEAASLSDIPLPWSKVLFRVEPDFAGALRSKARALDTQGKFDFTASSENFFEMLPKGVNKGLALEELARMKRVPRENIIAIGDNENDIEMLRFAGTGIAVRGACQPLKDAADLTLDCADGLSLFTVVRMLKNGDIPIRR